MNHTLPYWGIIMGIIKNHLAQMKAEQPEEYKRLMEGYASEQEFLREVLGLTNQAMKGYLDSKEGKIVNGN